MGEGPVTKLKENLIVKLLDAGENEIAHADIRTLEVIEKGYWDEVFSLEGEGGGGHVHMKLQFILSEEERNRIRVMRESVMKKKQERNSSINLRLSDITSSSCDAVQTSTHGEQKIPVIKNMKEESLEVKSQLRNYELMVQIEVEGASSSPVKHENEAESVQSSPVRHEIEAESPQVFKSEQSENIETCSPIIISDKKNSVTGKLEDDPIYKSQNRGLQKLSSNIRKMISAFETSKVQVLHSFSQNVYIFLLGNKEMCTLIIVRINSKDMVNMDSKQEANSPPKAPKVVIQSANRSFKKSKDDIRNENLHQTPTGVITRADIVPSNIEPSRVAKELDSSVTPSMSTGKASIVENIHREAPMEPIVKELEKSHFDVMETATDLGSIHEEQSRKASNVEDISREALREPIVKEIEKSSFDVTGQSTLETTKTLERIHEEQSWEASNVEDMSRAALSEPIVNETEKSSTDVMGKSTLETATSDPSLEAKHHHEKKIPSEPEMLEKKNSSSPKESGSGSSPDVSFNGLVGQMIKVVAIMGFGVLVLLTRQKEPRKKNREEKVSLFTIPNYIDGTTLTE
ncbi:hypothetical protein BUALT_Bualt09G0031800 [Buddleja alternifolia]|uniref:Uncharacterized protein n=1 Tax=Buddleja alternifolia TaxID=168488 RepID=A0AAV6XAA6_9LAMI|nr:hypothetical protein BUALT_Bualt09G0031800 [Buddleja alternifolia]